LRAQVCSAIWENESALQNAGESSTLEPAVISAASPSGAHQRRLMGEPNASNDVVCDGRVQVQSSFRASRGEPLSKQLSDHGVVIVVSFAEAFAIRTATDWYFPKEAVVAWHAHG